MVKYSIYFCRYHCFYGEDSMIKIKPSVILFLGVRYLSVAFYRILGYILSVLMLLTSVQPLRRDV